MSLANKPIHPTPAALMGECDKGQITMAHSSGMTLREHYAGLAMQGFIAAGVNGMPDPASVAFLAKEYADTLIEVLNNG